MKIIIGTLLMLCHFGLNETSPISTNEVTNKSLIQVDHDQQCPENWLLLDDKCFRISSEEATFDEAVTKCKKWRIEPLWTSSRYRKPTSLWTTFQSQYMWWVLYWHQGWWRWNVSFLCIIFPNSVFTIPIFYVVTDTKAVRKRWSIRILVLMIRTEPVL